MSELLSAGHVRIPGVVLFAFFPSSSTANHPSDRSSADLALTTEPRPARSAFEGLLHFSISNQNGFVKQAARLPAAPGKVPLRRAQLQPSLSAATEKSRHRGLKDRQNGPRVSKMNQGRRRDRLMAAASPRSRSQRRAREQSPIQPNHRPHKETSTTRRRKYVDPRTPPESRPSGVAITQSRATRMAPSGRMPSPSPDRLRADTTCGTWCRRTLGGNGW